MSDKPLSEELRDESQYTYSNIPVLLREWADRAAAMEDELIRTRVAVLTARNTHKEFDALFEKFCAVEAERDNFRQLHADADKQATKLWAANLALVKERDRLAAIIARVHAWANESNKVYDGDLESSIRNYDATEVLELLGGALKGEP